MSDSPITFNELNALRGIDTTRTIQSQIDSGAGGFQNPATADLSMGAYNVTQDGGNSTWVVPPSGGDDTSEILAAITAASTAGGGVVKLLTGVYTVSSSITCPTGMNNVTFAGSGAATILSCTAAVNTYAVRFNSAGLERAGNNCTKGDTSLTYTTASNAVLAVAGDYVIVKGTDVDGKEDAFWSIWSANGNVGTGIGTLYIPVPKTMTSVTIVSMPNGKNNTWRDMTVSLAAAPATFGSALNASGQSRMLVNNIRTVGFQLSPDGSNPIMEIANNVDSKLDRVLINQCQNDGIRLDYALNCEVSRTQVFKPCIAGNAAQAGIHFDATYDCLINSSVVNGSRANGIATRVLGRRNRVSNTWVMQAKLHGFKIPSAHETIIDGCIVEDCYEDSFSTGIYVTANATRTRVLNTTVSRCKYGIYIDSGSNHDILNSDIYSSSTYGITLAPTSKTTIKGGSVRGGAADAAIYISSSNNNHVDTTVSDQTGKGIVLAGTSSQNQININNIISTSGDAIELGATCDNNQVVGNMAFGLTIDDQGTGNTVTDNKVA